MQTTTNSNNIDGSDSTEDIQNLSAKKRKVICAPRPLISPLTTKDQSTSILRVPVMQTTTNSNNMDDSDSTEDIQNISAKKRKVVCALRPEVSLSSPITSPLAKTDQS